ncbi:MAG TPA: hypothetical protein VK327_15815, partial [Candidatus Paceibacterota bacterium]|nr:hypothetical protein [Candidatus Paceibacterota bacterium]
MGYFMFFWIEMIGRQSIHAPSAKKCGHDPEEIFEEIGARKPKLWPRLDPRPCPRFNPFVSDYEDDEEDETSRSPFFNRFNWRLYPPRPIVRARKPIQTKTRPPCCQGSG